MQRVMMSYKPRDDSMQRALEHHLVTVKCGAQRHAIRPMWYHALAYRDLTTPAARLTQTRCPTANGSLIARRGRPG